MSKESIDLESLGCLLLCLLVAVGSLILVIRWALTVPL